MEPGFKEIKMFTHTAGTLAYAAPERLSERKGYSEKVDIWGAGLVLFMMLIGSHPFDLDGSTVKLFAEILNGEQIVKE